MIDKAQIVEWVIRLIEMDAECKQMSREMEYEARRLGFETNGQHPLYQAWCLCGGIKHGIAAYWLQKAAAEMEDNTEKGGNDGTS